ncbi:MAG TPA: restriction endonuclease, SacI family [Thermoanaerobaculia bacterium]|nr:restriction endonuclease, SacI family [Thermoanaerobaculia bacterium]
MPSIDFDRARATLEVLFAAAESDLRNKTPPPVSDALAASIKKVFESKTQSYREVLLGAAVARLEDPSIDIREPYSNLGPHAYSGRTLDERVINPFLHDKRIPSSKGPFLAVFRRRLPFVGATRAAQKDSKSYDALLECFSFLEVFEDKDRVQSFVRRLLYEFVELRESSRVDLARLQRISLDQYKRLLDGLLNTPSGGLLPVLLVAAAFETIKSYFDLPWVITRQGINVADAASEAGGDITIKSGGRTVLTAEVTDREMTRERIVKIFNTKISPQSIQDYLCFLKSVPKDGEVHAQARRYFAQGHEVNFIAISEWILMIQATLGTSGRAMFNSHLCTLLEGDDVPKSVKVAWNEHISSLTI